MKYLTIFFMALLSACTMNGQQAENITVTEFERSIAKPNIQVLDVRTAEEYKSGHINNALQANWLNKTEFYDRTAHLDKNKPVYIYCLSGGRSSAAAAALREKGYQVTNLEGGIAAWKQSNKPLKGVDPNAKQTSMASYLGQVQSTSLVLVDFGAEWCPPCIKMEPVLQAFVKDNANKLTLIKMDGGIETELMKSLKVEALPTFILYENGKEVKRKQGLVTREEFNSWIKK
ncbi:MAG: rhodanese-like domain-containing protein [bacterium]|jgi:rhodanese-related sulfurtransferase